MVVVRSLTTAELSTDVLADIRRLLDEAFEGTFSDEDWEHALGGWHAIVTESGVVVAHAAVVGRDLDVADRRFSAGYVEGVAAVRSRQRVGLGSLAMEAISALLQRDFEMGALSTEVPGFYERLGWERWQGPSFVRHGSESVRTEDEDDGLMVLRFGPSAGIDLTAPLSCEARPGDDW